MSLYLVGLLAVITYRLLCVVTVLAYCLCCRLCVNIALALVFFNLKALRWFDLDVINWIVRYVKCAAWLPRFIFRFHVASPFKNADSYDLTQWVCATVITDTDNLLMNLAIGKIRYEVYMQLKNINFANYLLSFSFNAN